MSLLKHLCVALSIIALALLPACSKAVAPRPPSTATTTGARDTAWKTYDHGDFMFSHPGDWALNAKPAVSLSRVEEGVVSLNNFGRDNFCAETFTGTTYSYRSPAYVAKQLPRNGMYFEIVKGSGADGRTPPQHTGYSDIRTQTSTDYQREVVELQKHVRKEASGATAYAKDIQRELTGRKWVEYYVEFSTTEARYRFTAILIDDAVETGSAVAQNILKSLVIKEHKRGAVKAVGFAHAEEAAAFFGKAIRARNFDAAYLAASKELRATENLPAFKTRWLAWYKYHDATPDRIWTQLAWVSTGTRDPRSVKVEFTLSDKRNIAIVYVQQYDDGLWYIRDATSLMHGQ